MLRAQARRPARAAHRAPVHQMVAPVLSGLPVPLPVQPPQQHVVLAVAVEVADAGHPPPPVRRQRRFAAPGNTPPAVHRVVVPAAAPAPHQHIVPPVAVEVPNTRNRHRRVARELPVARPRQHPPAVQRVVAPVPVRVAQQRVRPAVAVEVAEPAQVLGRRAGAERMGRTPLQGDARRPRAGRLLGDPALPVHRLHQIHHRRRPRRGAARPPMALGRERQPMLPPLARRLFNRHLERRGGRPGRETPRAGGGSVPL